MSMAVIFQCTAQLLLLWQQFEPTEVLRPFYLHVYGLGLLKEKVTVHVTITCDALSSTMWRHMPNMKVWIWVPISQHLSISLHRQA